MEKKPKNYKKLIFILPLLALSACVDPDSTGSRTIDGGLIGGGAGAVIGAIAGGGNGALIGGLSGGALGAGVGYATAPNDGYSSD